MLFFLTCLYTILYYIRPSEWVPGMIGTPLMFLVGLVSITGICFALLGGKGNLFASGAASMTLGYGLAILCSQLSKGYFTGTVQAFNAASPAIVGYFLIVSSLDSRERLNRFVLLLILLSTFLAFEGWLQHATGFSHGGMDPYLEHKIYDDGTAITVPRIRWYGTFNDPNDLGLALVIVIPFLLDMMLRGRYLLPVGSLALVTTAIYFTNSRGSVLAALASTMAYFVFRYRSMKGLVLGFILAVPLLIFGPSRMSQVTASEESAHGRVDAWYQGYQMFKAHPFFGVGQGMFTDYHPITAHNSFVLVMAELGMVGTFFFTGIIYYAFFWVWQGYFRRPAMASAADAGLISATYASLSGLLAAMFFLSRAYVLVPFIVLALATAVSRLCPDCQPPVVRYNKHLLNISMISCAEVLLINLVVKFFI
jgi:putative inorganic carbon (hco3(-)) transporter